MGSRLDKLFMELSAGQMFAGDFEILLELSKGKDVVVELGTARGLGAMMLSVNARRVYTVDHFKVVENKSGTHILSRKEQEEWVSGISKYLQNWNNVEVLHGNSAATSRIFEDGAVDLLYIDADHNYVHAKYDYDTWLPKVKHGGLILFHDYHEQHKGVWKLVNELIETECANGILEEVEHATENCTVIKIFRKV